MVFDVAAWSRPASAVNSEKCHGGRPQTRYSVLCPHKKRADTKTNILHNGSTATVHPNVPEQKLLAHLRLAVLPSAKVNQSCSVYKEK
jgi:hypothetical protein